MLSTGRYRVTLKWQGITIGETLGKKLDYRSSSHPTRSGGEASSASNPLVVYNEQFGLVVDPYAFLAAGGTLDTATTRPVAPNSGP